MKEKLQSNQDDIKPSVEQASRREAINKLGKYGKVSAVVTAVVYSGLNGAHAQGFFSPPPPPGG